MQTRRIRSSVRRSVQSVPKKNKKWIVPLFQPSKFAADLLKNDRIDTIIRRILYPTNLFLDRPAFPRGPVDLPRGSNVVESLDGCVVVGKREKRSQVCRVEGREDRHEDPPGGEQHPRRICSEQFVD